MKIIKVRFWNGEKMLYKDLFNIPKDISYIGEPMLFTGLLDKHGKEIYEGDIIKHSKNAYTPFENSLSEVYWFDLNYAYYFRKRHMKRDNDDKKVWDSESLGNISGGLDDKFEVIGNIYENPELLKQ